MLLFSIGTNRDTRCQTGTWHCTDAVVDTATGTIYISGQVDWDMNYQVSSHTVEEQLKNVLNNLTTVLDAAGSSIENLLANPSNGGSIDRSITP